MMVKEKPNSTRIYDADGFKRRAACICVKNDSEDQVNTFSLLFHYFSHLHIWDMIRNHIIRHIELARRQFFQFFSPLESTFRFTQFANNYAYVHII